MLLIVFPPFPTIIRKGFRFMLVKTGIDRCDFLKRVQKIACISNRLNSLPKDKILDFVQIESICKQENKCG